MSKEKDKNPFKFQGFSERIANIRLDISHRVEKRASEPEETETFCNEALNKWKELNCTVQFQQFWKEIHPFVQTLAQLVHHEQTVMKTLQKYLLQENNSLALEPLLNVVVQISRDLQSDFYPYFKDVFNVFVTLLNRYVMDSDVLELIFTTLGYLFKFLWRYMVKDIENMFSLYSPLLSIYQKPYIRQFAAESFSFLMRKVKNHDQLLNFLFGFLATHEDMVEGLGYLCFEMVKGVQKQFHSMTERIFPLMLTKLGPINNDSLPTALPWPLVFECLLHTIKLMAKYTTTEGSHVVEKSLTSQLMKLYNISETIYGEEEMKALTFQLSYVLELTNFWVSFKGGTYVSDHLIMFDVVSALLKAPQVAQQISTPLLNLTSSILVAEFSGLHKDIHQKQLIKSVYQLDGRRTVEYPVDKVLDFTRSLLNWSSFCSDILPVVLTYCQSKLFSRVDNEDKESIILILAQIVLSGAVNQNYGIDVTSSKGLIYLPKSATKAGGKILDCFLDYLEDVVKATNLGLVWGVLVCLPCISPLPGQKCAKKILDFLTRSLEQLWSEREVENSQLWLFVISQAVLSYLVINPHPKNEDEQLGMDLILKILRKYPANVHMLHSVAAILSHATSANQNEVLSTDNLRKVYPLIKMNLSNPAHLVRQKTLQILKEFKQMDFIATEEIPQNFQPGPCNLFEVCLAAESTPPTFQQHRDKEILLRKLTYSTTYHKSLPEFYHEVMPRFLIGQLYVNFRPIWQPVMEILKSHAHGQDVKMFWAVLLEHLELAATNAEKILDSGRTSSTVDRRRYQEGKMNNLEDLFTNLFSVATGQREDNRADHINFRYLLWKTMAEFPGVVELKSRNLVPLLLRFMSNEYEQSDENTIPSQDIRKKEQQDKNDITLPIATDLDQSVMADQGTPDQHHTKRRKGATKSLCVHLTLFSLFNNPKALSKQPQVRQIYLTMLGHRDGEIQKLAVKCLMTYRFSYVMPYKDNLERLLEDESFRDELSLLTMDEGNAVVDTAHREGLMPIVIRLLYGKMQRWTGAGSSGKSGVGIRRGTVLRFLGNCSLEELTVFMDLILAPFKHLCTDPDVIPTPRDLSSVIPIRKQLGFLNMMQQLLLNLGSTFDAFLPSLLQICLALLSTCVFALRRREEIHPPHISQLKQVRQLAISRLIEFFEAKPDYDYSVVTDMVYEAAVWPQLENLEQESIQSPTPLLRLLHTWTKRPRYFPLLSRKPTNSPGMSIMGHVFNCLNACHVSHSVVTMVMEMANNLLSVAEDDGSEEDTDMMELGEEPSSTSSLESTIPYGVRLVLPHLSIIIHHLVQTVKSLTKSAKQGPRKTKAVLPKLDLSVLSKISPFVSDSENSGALINLLLPFIYLRQREETEVDTLRTVKNLLSNVESPAGFTKQLARLFAQLNSRTSRERLCEVFEEIARLDPSYETISLIVTQMNSWHVKKIEEPDYEKRMAGFSAAVGLVSGAEKVVHDPGSPPTPSSIDSPPMDFVLAILHNCLYFVHRSADMAIRDGAIGGIDSVVQRVAQRKDSEEFDELIVNCILPSCKLALRSKNEAARNEFVGILATMVRQFDHTIFKDMRILVDNDPEADFFENIRHIQLHRRVRALRRIESLCQKNTFKPSTLLAFLLPMATVYLFEYSDNKDHNLVAQAIATVGAISGCLPWSKYSSLLRLYLRMLGREKERQKTVVKVVVAVLNGFHFDLSSYNLKIEPTPETSQEKEREASKENTEGIDVQEEQREEEEEDADEGEEDEIEDVDENDEDTDVTTKKEGLTEALAKKIYDTITTKIVPPLNKSLTKKNESYHKLSHTKADDQQEALRVPIALAMVKLLKSLPQHTLHLHLPGLLLRVCNTLKSRARDVRDAARNVLCQIALSLGTKYFSFIIKEMKSTLTRGYQLHVLGFTIHSLLDRMLPTLAPGDLDYCIPSLTEILIEDLFGEVATEREVERLANKLHEAKSSKSYESFEILAKVIGSTSISQLVSPLQQVLDSKQSHKLSRRAEEALRKISVGLQANARLSTQTLMLFIHRIIHEKLPSITAKKMEKDEAANSGKTDSQPETSHKAADCYVLPALPVRGGKTPGTSTKTNAHIIVEFGLQLLNTALKRGKISGKDQIHLQMLDPFVDVLSNCLQTMHVKVLTLSLRCLCMVIKLPLPSLASSVPHMAKLLFKCLKTHATAGAKDGENYEMVLSAFKAMTVIIRDFNKYTIAENHLQVLLGFVEEDIHDHTRQGTAFPLLRAILKRKLLVPEIHDVMKKVSQLSITGATPTVQQQCRQCVMQYLLDYPLGKKLQRLLEFYVSQLSYEHETGRESALDMIASIFKGFPEPLLSKYASFFFLPLTTRLVNDDSATCRKSTASAIKTLLQKLDVDRRDILFRMVTEWSTNEKVILRRLAAQVCGLFVEVEGKAFDRRLPTTLPVISEIIKPEHYDVEEEEKEDESRNDMGSSNRGLDHLLFNALTTLSKILQESRLVWDVKIKKDMDPIWVSVESHLLHPHAWIRLVSCRLFGLLFAAWKPEELTEKAAPETPDYLATNTRNKVVQLCNSFCLQLESPFLENELSDQIIKNLVFISKLLFLYDNGVLQSQKSSSKSGGDENGEEFTFKSLLNKLEKLTTHEASQAPKNTQKRSCVMRWIAAVTTVLGKESVIPFLREILQPIHRELYISTNYKDPELQKTTREVLDLVKSIVGRDAVSRVYAELQSDITHVKEKRMKKRALETVADPALVARRKMKRNLMKKEARKRKIDKFKPERKLKKMRQTDQDD